MTKHIKRMQDIPLSTYVIFSIAVLLIYTVVSLILSVFGVQNDTLTTCIFSTFGSECLTCGVIKVFKLHKEYKIKNGIES
jgi:hypothetical protein